MPAIRTLLSHAIDYAGLFPPASLAMRPAVEAFAGYVAGPDAWALGRFVVPGARLEELEREAADLLPRSGSGGPWRLAALVAPDADPGLLLAFNARHARAGQVVAMIDTVEVKATTPDEVAAAGTLTRSMATFVEIPVDGPVEPLVEAIHAIRARAKIRTGGVTADAAPTPAQVLRFLKACLAAGVPFKATAGLHHPLRGEHRLTYERDAGSGTMFGFLNVFLAAAFLRAGLPDDEALRLLEERDAASLDLTGDDIRWRDHALPAADLARAREQSILSFGSCSFLEPLDEVRPMAGPV